MAIFEWEVMMEEVDLEKSSFFGGQRCFVFLHTTILGFWAMEFNMMRLLPSHIKPPIYVGFSHFWVVSPKKKVLEFPEFS